MKWGVTRASIQMLDRIRIAKDVRVQEVVCSGRILQVKLYECFDQVKLQECVEVLGGVFPCPFLCTMAATPIGLREHLRKISEAMEAFRQLGEELQVAQNSVLTKMEVFRRQQKAFIDSCRLWSSQLEEAENLAQGESDLDVG